MAIVIFSSCKFGSSNLETKKSVNNKLPDTENPLVVRTDFSTNTEWENISARLIGKNEMGFQAHVDFLDDMKFERIKTTEIISAVAPNYKHDFIFVADSLTFAHPENTILCIDLYEVVGRTFRVIPSEVWGVENNLSISNVEFVFFYENCDNDGVFRGF